MEKNIKKPATKDKKNLSVLIGAAFLMATSAVGPGFMTQTATFSESLGGTMGFVILVSAILELIAQLNCWRVISVSGARGQDIANKVLPGLGYVVAAFVALGGLAFNIGNVGGAALGLNVIFGINVQFAAAIGGIIGIIIFANKKAGAAMDRFAQIMGGVMIILIAYVAIVSDPPVGEAIKGTFMPQSMPMLQILTLVGGTVGGYITFSGGHRLVDAGITGEENLKQVNSSALMGLGAATVVRILLFLAAFGVVYAGNKLDPTNPAASSFQIAAGTVGYKIFGVVFCAAALTSIVGAAYTSVSFLKTLSKPIAKYENRVIIAFIAVSTLIFMIIGKPAKLLVLVGTLNGLILPLTLTTILIASKRKDIVGDYKHAQWLFIGGWIVVAITAFLGLKAIPDIAALWR
ncbi:MAG: hypothetical protein K0Q97_1944 [Bacillota bacterium]|jgi:Mn2+/Fe2+ NRAMP family transporter|nr:hypothetical protein [Bacillota bacterium]